MEVGDRSLTALAPDRRLREVSSGNPDQPDWDFLGQARRDGDVRTGLLHCLQPRPSAPWPGKIPSQNPPFRMPGKACWTKGIPRPRNASVLQKWPLSGHLALFRGSKRQPRKHHFDQCLRGFWRQWAFPDLNRRPRACERHPGKMTQPVEYAYVIDA